MFHYEATTLTMLQEVFAEEIAQRRGCVSDTFVDPPRLILRSILPEIKEIGKQDRMQGGVAMRSNGCDVWVHPYLFRQVCSNGAIMAQAIQSLHVGSIDQRPAEEVLPEVREAIIRCAAPEAFETGVGQMRDAQLQAADLALMVAPLFSQVPHSAAAAVLRQVLRFHDRTIFGFANAVTAAARDTQDPEVRWELEELGGSIFARIDPPRPRLDDHAQPTREREADEVFAL